MTMQRPLEDRYLLTEPELRDRLVILLGGRTAEELSFGQISTGAQNDLERATEIARAMVTEYGMSGKLGPLSFGHNGFRGREGQILFPAERQEMSEATARLVDEEVSKLVNDAHNRAREILQSRKDLMAKLSAVLMTREVIEGQDLRDWVEGKRPIPDPTEEPEAASTEELSPAPTGPSIIPSLNE
jgi:cell division protease FtsH